MRHVYTGRDEMDAHFVKGLLEQQGIRAVVEGENLEGAWGTLPLSPKSLPQVWVNDDDEPRAAEVVAEYRNVDRANADPAGEDAKRMTWVCANCGERNEEQFDRCWKCTHPRPAEADPHVTGPH